MPRGGKRSGKPGTAYSNRSDLTQAPSAAPGQTYGTATAQLQAQKVAPLPQQAGPPPPAAGSAPGVAQAPGAAPAGPMPGALGPLNRPTERPGEPLTAGMPLGPGPSAPSPPDPLVKAAAVLNTLGHTADPVATLLRARINAALGNQGAA